MKFTSCSPDISNWMKKMENSKSIQISAKLLNGMSKSDDTVEDENNNTIIIEQTKKKISKPIDVIDIDDVKLISDEHNVKRKKKRKLSTLDQLLPQVEAKKRKEEEEEYMKRRHEDFFIHPREKRRDEEEYRYKDICNENKDADIRKNPLPCDINKSRVIEEFKPDQLQEKSPLNELIHFVGQESKYTDKPEISSLGPRRRNSSHDMSEVQSGRHCERDLPFSNFSTLNKPGVITSNISKKRNKRTISTNQRYSTLSNAQLQRRLVANARERSRVHALSNAFDSLRATIPSYSSEQKLSKLTILKVAINYIKALDQILNMDSKSNNQQRFETYVSECSRILQTEYGRSKTKLSFE